MSVLVTGRWFPAKDYAKAVEHKEETNAIMVRKVHPVLGVGYDVIYIVPRVEKE